jgi:hypothetical protein
MAVWQIRIELIPRVACEGENPLRSREARADTSDLSAYWRLAPPIPALEAVRLLDNALTRGSHWSDGGLVWGDLEDNCVEVYLHGDALVQATLRFSCRRPDSDFVSNCLRVARALDCVCVLSTGAIVEPELEAIARHSHEVVWDDPERPR